MVKASYSRLCACAIIAALGATPRSAFADTRDLYAEINVRGSVTVSVLDRDGRPRCARLWWVTRLTGGVRQLGPVCGTQTLAIPSFLGISLASKLRGSAEPGTLITLAAREGPARTITVHF